MITSIQLYLIGIHLVFTFHHEGVDPNRANKHIKKKNTRVNRDDYQTQAIAKSSLFSERQV